MLKIHTDKAEIKKGIDQAANVIKSTLGAKGKTVLISSMHRPLRATKDGVSVAREITLSDELQNLGAKIVRQASEETLDAVGDGTTTAALLVQSIATEALTRIDAGADPILIKEGLDKTLPGVLEEIEKQKQEIKSKEEIEFVASISANDPEIGKILADIFHKIGKQGVVSIQDSPSFVNEWETVVGMRVDKGYASPYFITDPEKRTCVLEDASVIILEGRPDLRTLTPALDELLKSGKRTFLFVAEDYEDSFLANLLINRARGVFNAVAVKAPGFGEKRKGYLEDIAVLTGAKLSAETGRSEFAPEDTGNAKKVVVSKDHTDIIGGAGDEKEVEKRVKWLEFEKKQTSSEYERADLQSRIGKLTGGVAIFKVGGTTELEVKERKDRVEDAVAATRAALEDGIVCGGGIALLNAKKEMKVEGYGEILLNSLEAPFKTILKNAGKNPNEVQSQLSGRMGYNVKEGRIEEDMVTAGIIDPVKVVKIALINAVSAVGSFITSDYSIVEYKDEPNP